jgi:RHS repeat-associated protein
MTSTQTAGNTRIDNRYDPLRRQVLKQVSSWDTSTANWVLQKTVRFTYDGWNVIEEEQLQDSGSGFQPLAITRHIWGTDVSGTLQGAGGVGGLLKAEETIGTAASSHYYWYDGNGNVVGLMRGNGTVDAVYRYSAFGGKAEVSVNSSTFAARNPYRFSTKYLDAEVETTEGTYYYGYRHYATALGRWLSREPLQERGGANLYGFVYNQPTGYVDVLGMNPFAAAIPATAGAALTDGPLPIGDALLAGARIGAGLWELGEAIDDALSRPRNRRRWVCDASCNVQKIREDACCSDRVTGSGAGPTQDATCRDAKRNAGQSTQEGCYPRHCRCFNCRQI